MNIKYDVDTLFVVKKEAVKAERISHFQFSEIDARLKNYAVGDVPGFNRNGTPETIDGMPLPYFLENLLTEKYVQISELTSILDTSKDNREKAAAEDRLKDLNEETEKLANLLQVSARNAIVDLVTSNLREMRNRTDLLTPISFSGVSRIKSETRKEMLSLLEDVANPVESQFILDLLEAGFITKIDCKNGM